MSLQLEGLWKFFGDLPAVAGVDCQIHPERIYALVGPNGAGKSTLFRLVAGLLAPSKGRVLINGLDTRSDDLEIRRSIGLVHEEVGLNDQVTGLQELTFVGLSRGLSKEAISRSVSTLGDLLNLEQDALSTRCGRLSKGNRQKIGIIRALIGEPPILLLDEPTSNLDPESAIRLWDYLFALRDRGNTILIATHLLDEAETTASHVLGIHSGQLLVDASMKDILATEESFREYYIRRLGSVVEKSMTIH